MASGSGSKLFRAGCHCAAAPPCLVAAPLLPLAEHHQAPKLPRIRVQTLSAGKPGCSRHLLVGGHLLREVVRLDVAHHSRRLPLINDACGGSGRAREVLGWVQGAGDAAPGRRACRGPSGGGACSLQRRTHLLPPPLKPARSLRPAPTHPPCCPTLSWTNNQHTCMTCTAPHLHPRPPACRLGTGPATAPAPRPPAGTHQPG